MTRRLPKIGFNNKRFAHVYNQVNIDVFNRFEDGAVVGIDELVASGIIKKVEPDSKSSATACLKRNLQSKPTNSPRLQLKKSKRQAAQ